MPSPVGHVIAGAAIGRAITPDDPRVVWWCAILATSADVDLLFPGAHRTVTHSVGAVMFVTILAILVTGKVTAVGVRPGDRSGDRSGTDPGRVGVRPRVCPLIVGALVAAFASHIILDWLGADPTPPQGIKLLWPFSDGWYISGWDIFRGTARRNIFTARSMWINATAIAQEIAITGPIAWVVFRLRN